MSKINMQKKIKKKVPFLQLVSIFEQLNKEEKIDLIKKLEESIEKNFSDALNDVWIKNKNKNLKQMLNDVDYATKKIRKVK